MRFSRLVCAVVGVVVVLPGWSMAQCGKGGSQGGKGPGFGSARTSSMSSPGLTTSQGLRRNPNLQQGLPQQLLLQQALQNQQQQLLLQQALQQQQALAMQQAVAQQQLNLQNLLALATQQSDATLRNALSNPNAQVRSAASQELSRRGETSVARLGNPFGGTTSTR